MRTHCRRHRHCHSHSVIAIANTAITRTHTYTLRERVFLSILRERVFSKYTISHSQLGDENNKKQERKKENTLEAGEIIRRFFISSIFVAYRLLLVF